MAAEIVNEISEFLQKGRAKNVKKLVQQALDEGVDAKEILEEGLLSGMMTIGGKFKRNEVFVPEVLVAARAMNAGVTILEPKLIEIGNEPIGKAVIGTVKGDLHDIGKNLVAMMIESAGFEVIDLGVDVSNDKIIECYRENPDTKIIALSALLTTTMPALHDAVDALNKSDFRSNIKVMVGGAPITQEFADEIGADGYSEDAASAATLANQLIGA